MAAASVYPGRDENPALRRLQRMYGTYKEIAVAGGVTPQAVCLWMGGKRKPSAETCMRIDRATKGKVSLRDLRPDLFRR